MTKRDRMKGTSGEPSQSNLPKLEDAVETVHISTVGTEENNVDPVLKANVEGRKAAEDVIDLIRTELGGQANAKFWELIKQEAVTQLHEAPVLEESTPKSLTVKAATEMLKEQMPNGRYLGRTVRFVLKKDPNYLQSYAFEPSLFQKRLRRLLVSKLPKDKPKKAKKG